MPTTFTKGDLFHHEGLNAFAHGCNCAGAMGKGIAVAFRERYPAMYAEYKQRCADGRFALGDVFMWREGETTIFNLGTQRTWKTKAVPSAVEASITAMVRLAEANHVASIGLPRIAAGLGGMPWPRVRALLASAGENTSIQLIVFEEYESAT